MSDVEEPEGEEVEVELCKPDSKVDNRTRFFAGMILVGVVMVDMSGLWSKDPPWWFLGILILLVLGVEISAIRQIALDVVRKYAEKK